MQGISLKSKPLLN